MDSKEPRLAAFQSIAERRACARTQRLARARARKTVRVRATRAATNDVSVERENIKELKEKGVKLGGFHSGRAQQANLSSETPEHFIFSFPAKKIRRGEKKLRYKP